MDAVKILGQLMNNSNGAGGNMLGQLLGGAMGGGQQQQQQSGGGLGGLLAGLTGGGQQQQSGGGMGGLGGMLAGLTGGQSQGGAQAGGMDLGALLGGLTGGGQQQSGGSLGGLAALLGGGAGNNASSFGGGQAAGGLAGGGLASILGAALGGMGGNQAVAQQAVQDIPAEEVDQGAKLMIQAMINAAKCDGQIDSQEQSAIIEKLGGDLSQEEVDYVRGEMSSPLDIQAFVNAIPRGAEEQVYAFSLFGMTLDTQVEAQYMGRLAEELGINGETANQIHAQVGAPQIFG